MAHGPYLAAAPHRFLGEVVDTGQCVRFVQQAADVPMTPKWRAGPKVRGNASIQPGTAIATFERDGTYTSAPGNHAAIYIGQTDDGILVYDQWRRQPVHKRLIRFAGGGNADDGSKSNDGDLYRVIR
ncbi:BPSL0067 family protein [Marinivivus vitaminiproducens]|uniref:BPSL0067 family protein n=1 Tax=Marinivivus vitaminiproducens TaxID=3035935 RepID=UPI0027A575E2|nr:BPSL0067 family protein [Geminicoccaceae bacterium SCSIO 64248]